MMQIPMQICDKKFFGASVGVDLAGPSLYPD